MPSEQVEAWLTPMVDELIKRHGRRAALSKVGELVLECLVPTAAIDSPLTNLRASLDFENDMNGLPPGASSGHAVIDYLRVGQKLREELDWYSYPTFPDEEEP